MALRWEGREVTFVTFNIRTGRAVRAAFAKDPEDGYQACLAASARYMDTGEPVFKSVDEIEDLPFPLQQRINRLAAEAVKQNAILDIDDDEDAAPRPTNGSGEHAGPSH